jgi:hypothetical protein
MGSCETLTTEAIFGGPNKIQPGDELRIAMITLLCTAWGFKGAELHNVARMLAVHERSGFSPSAKVWLVEQPIMIRHSGWYKDGLESEPYADGCLSRVFRAGVMRPYIGKGIVLLFDHTIRLEYEEPPSWL